MSTPEIAAAAASAVRLLEEAGAVVEEVDPGIEDPFPIFRTLWFAAAARLLANLPEAQRGLVEPGLAEVAAQGARDRRLGALDALTRMMMQELLLDIWTRVRTTIVFVTHDIDEALFLADRVLVMSPDPGGSSRT